MISSSTDYKNLSINHACRAIFECCKCISHLPGRDHEILSFMTKINPNPYKEFAYTIIYSAGLKMDKGKLSGVIFSVNKFKIDIDFATYDNVSFHGSFVSYMAINKIPNSPDKCLHLITDTGVFMYRGNITVHPVK